MTLNQLAAHSTGTIAARPADPVRVWLFAVAALVFALVSVGGATRLTGSGLSITEWQPIMGVVPPLSDAAWHEAFEKYRQIPQYTHVNRGMSLEAFKGIFWWEWTHRFLARLIGVVFLVPFLFFLATGRISRALAAEARWPAGARRAAGRHRLVHGAVGARRTHQRQPIPPGAASGARRTGLCAACCGRRCRSVRRRLGAGGSRPAERRTAALLVGLVFLQLVAGAFVAGLKAGAGYNTWPLMDGQFVPDGLGVMSPWWANLFENATTVQFNHRMLAYAILAVVLWHVWSLAARTGDHMIRASALALAGATVGQAALGIWTLLAQVPLSLGLAHQAGAFVVFGLALWHLHLVLPQRDG